jgi:hypothetical protein
MRGTGFLARGATGHLAWLRLKHDSAGRMPAGPTARMAVLRTDPMQITFR